MEAVKIEWIDSCSSHMHWTLKEDLEDETIEAVKITTYGVVVQTSDDTITVAQNYGVNPKQFCGMITIPKGCIVKHTLLEMV